MTIAYWAPNQAAIAQVETYQFTVPNGAGNHYIATINGKSVTYVANTTDGLTAAAAATGLYNLLNVSEGIAPELAEIEFANPSSGVLTATARTPGVPFANVTINGVSGQGLVLSTGNGLANGITTTHTTPNASPSDVYDAQNWLRVTAPAPPVRGLPQNGDDIVVANTNVPMLWNLDRLSAIEANTYTRHQSFEGTIGLPENNPNGYTEWRATYLKFNGPQGSVPAGGLAMVLGYNSGSGSGPTREHYDLQSSPVTMTVLAAGQPEDEYGIRFKSVHGTNVIKVLGTATVAVAMLPGEIATLSQECIVSNGGVLAIGPGVTWSSGATLTMYGGTTLLNAAPNTLRMENGSQATIATNGLTWATVTMRGGSQLIALAGGTISNLTMETGSVLDKSLDQRPLTITNTSIDGDTCVIIDPMNAIVFTNPVNVYQQVTAGPFLFTGPKSITIDTP